MQKVHEKDLQCEAAKKAGTTTKKVREPKTQEKHREQHIVGRRQRGLNQIARPNGGKRSKKGRVVCSQRKVQTGRDPVGQGKIRPGKKEVGPGGKAKKKRPTLKGNNNGSRGGENLARISFFGETLEKAM